MPPGRGSPRAASPRARFGAQPRSASRWRARRAVSAGAGARLAQTARRLYHGRPQTGGNAARPPTSCQRAAPARGHVGWRIAQRAVESRHARHGTSMANWRKVSLVWATFRASIIFAASGRGEPGTSLSGHKAGWARSPQMMGSQPPIARAVAHTLGVAKGTLAVSESSAVITDPTWWCHRGFCHCLAFGVDYLFSLAGCWFAEYTSPDPSPPPSGICGSAV